MAQNQQALHLVPRLQTFRLLYLVTFGVTLYILVSQSFMQFTLYIAEANQGTMNVWLAKLGPMAFGVAVMLHLCRLYLSLEQADEDRDFFTTYLEPLPRWARPVELFLRIAMIAVVSLKAAQITDIRIEQLEELGLFVLWLYSVLLAWDIFMWWMRGVPEKKFLRPDLAGFLVGLLLRFGSVDPEAEKGIIFVEATGMLIAAGTIYWFVGRDLWSNRQRYLDEVLGDLRSWLRSTNATRSPTLAESLGVAALLALVAAIVPLVEHGGTFPRGATSLCILLGFVIGAVAAQVEVRPGFSLWKFLCLAAAFVVGLPTALMIRDLPHTPFGVVIGIVLGTMAGQLGRRWRRNGGKKGEAAGDSTVFPLR